MPFATELEIDKIEWRTLREQYRKVSLQNGDRTQVHMKDQGNIGLDDIKQRTELEFATSMIIAFLKDHTKYTAAESTAVIGSPLQPMLANYEAEHRFHRAMTELLYLYNAKRFAEALRFSEIVEKYNQEWKEHFKK